MEREEYNNIILFDGQCNLCNGFVQFVFNNEKDEILTFASLQSEVGKTILSKYHTDTNKIDSIILVSNNMLYTKSDAILKILPFLKPLWGIFKTLKIVPVFLRNKIYDYVAKNRYAFFGKKESCWLPTLELKHRFLSDK